jgi:5-methyltetrahydrofolate--homocysteine methyltransferase
MLPLIKEYGAAVIGLAQDDEGIPKTADKRVAVAYKIAEAADKIGIPREDIIIDVMTYSIGAEAKSGKDVLEALIRIMVIHAGGTALIADAAKVMPTVLAADLVLGRDRFARRYLEGYRKREAAKAAQA